MSHVARGAGKAPSRSKDAGILEPLVGDGPQIVHSVHRSMFYRISNREAVVGDVNASFGRIPAEVWLERLVGNRDEDDGDD